MIDRFDPRPEDLQRLQVGPIAPHLRSFAALVGHESMDTTQMYLHANIELKEKALAKTEPFRGQHRRYRLPDQLLAFLQAL